MSCSVVKVVVFKDIACAVYSWTRFVLERKRERQRETERETERKRKTETERQRDRE